MAPLFCPRAGARIPPSPPGEQHRPSRFAFNTLEKPPCDSSAPRRSPAVQSLNEFILKEKKTKQIKQNNHVSKLLYPLQEGGRPETAAVSNTCWRKQTSRVCGQARARGSAASGGGEGGRDEARSGLPGCSRLRVRVRMIQSSSQ